MRLTFFLIPAVFTALSACNEFPELDQTVDSDARDASYPDLVPIDTIQSGIPDQQIEPETQDELDARVDRLKARADRLSGAVIDDATQERMQAGIEPVSE